MELATNSACVSKSRVNAPRGDASAAKEVDLIPRLMERIKLREMAIKAEQEQVQLVQGINDALRVNLDQVEAEVQTLQEALAAANEKVRIVTKDKQRLEKRVAGLEASMSSVKGQEYAIDVATKQNTKLLLLLQDEEKQRKELERVNQVVQDEAAMLRDKLSSATRDFAGIEAKIKTELSKRTQAFNRLQATHEQLCQEHAELQAVYKQETGELTGTVATLEKQLDAVKAQPYQLLDRLQKAEGDLRRACDDQEQMLDQMKILEEQNGELQTHLHDAIRRGNEFKTQMDFFRKNVPTIEKELASLKAKLDFERHDKSNLETQLYEMSQTITNLLRRQARVEEDAIYKEKELHTAIKDRDNEGYKTSQELSSKERTIVKLEKRVQVLETALVKSTVELEAANLKIQSSTEAADLPLLLDLESAARRRLLTICFRLVGSVSLEAPIAVHEVQHLDFTGCALSNGDLASLLQCLKGCPFVQSLRVDKNDISDQGTHAVSEYVRSRECRLALLSLRGNAITAQGMRRIAIALEHATDRGIKHVLLSGEGLIEAYATVRPDRDEAGHAVPVIMVVDVRECASPSTSVRRTSADCLKMPHATAPDGQTTGMDRRDERDSTTAELLREQRAYRNMLTARAYGQAQTIAQVT